MKHVMMTLKQWHRTQMAPPDFLGWGGTIKWEPSGCLWHPEFRYHHTNQQFISCRHSRKERGQLRAMPVTGTGST